MYVDALTSVATKILKNNAILVKNGISYFANKASQLELKDIHPMPSCVWDLATNPVVRKFLFSSVICTSLYAHWCKRSYSIGASIEYEMQSTIG